MKETHDQFRDRINDRLEVLLTKTGLIGQAIDILDSVEDDSTVLRKVAAGAVDAAKNAMPTLTKRANAPITMDQLKTVLMTVARSIGEHRTRQNIANRPAVEAALAKLAKARELE